MRVKPFMSDDDYAAKMEHKGLTPDGSAFIPDPTPLEPPLGYIKQPSITERIREMVRSEHLRRAAEEAGAETFEEADDFDVADDYDPASPYEEVFDPSPTPVSTGVPPPSGGREGTGGDPALPPVNEPPEGEGGEAATPPPPAVKPLAASPKPRKPPPGPI